METKNYKNLITGTLAAAATLLITSIVYYNLVEGAPFTASALVNYLLSALVVSFAISYLCWKSKKTTKSHLVTALVVGILVSVIILSLPGLLSYEGDEVIVCCQGDKCWVLVLQIMFAASAAAATGKTGSGGDD